MLPTEPRMPGHLGTLEWYIADCRFMLLLDEVGRNLEPAYRLRKRLHAADGRSERTFAR